MSDVGNTITPQLWIEIMAESARNPELQRTFINSDKVMRNSMAAIIKNGINAGEFRFSVNPEETTIMLFALMDGLIVRKAINPEFSFCRYVHMFREMMRGILIV